jgi:hypothetical protein
MKDASLTLHEGAVAYSNVEIREDAGSSPDGNGNSTNGQSRVSSWKRRLRTTMAGAAYCSWGRVERSVPAMTTFESWAAVRLEVKGEMILQHSLMAAMPRRQRWYLLRAPQHPSWAAMDGFRSGSL